MMSGDKAVSLGKRFAENPIIHTQDILPSQPGLIVECVLNPGAFTFQEKTWLLIRVAERPLQKTGYVSLPVLNEDGTLKILEYSKTDPDLDLSDARYVKYKGVTYLSTLSHLRLMCSSDGIHFKPPTEVPNIIYGKGKLETFGIEDCRVAHIEGTYYLTFTEVSENGVGVGMMRTTDWIHFERDGMIIPPHNKDCALFEEKINGKFYCFHRPSGIDLGGNYIWLSSSPDAKHWGDHQCILRSREKMWDSQRIGAGTSPIKTSKGWLEIYHGADENQRYCLGAFLCDLEHPSRIIARSQKPVMEPEMDYELNGFFGNVVFTNGHVVKGDQLVLYYGASDQVICGAVFSIAEILAELV